MFIVGICGGSGSGKTTIVKRLAAGPLGGTIAVLNHDHYYRNREDMSAEIADSENWDHPDALDNSLFVSHLDDLRAGRPIHCPSYDFATHRRRAEGSVVMPQPIVVADGILLLAIEEVRRRIDLAVYISTPDTVRMERRRERDHRERGRSLASIDAQLAGTVMPMHHQFVEPSARFAHLIVPWEFDNPTAVMALTAALSQRIGA